MDSVKQFSEDGAKDRKAAGGYYDVYLETVESGVSDEDLKMGSRAVGTHAFQISRSTVIPGARSVTVRPQLQLVVIHVKSE